MKVGNVSFNFKNLEGSDLLPLLPSIFSRLLQFLVAVTGEDPSQQPQVNDYGSGNLWLNVLPSIFGNLKEPQRCRERLGLVVAIHDNHFVDDYLHSFCPSSGGSEIRICNGWI